MSDMDEVIRINRKKAVVRNQAKLQLHTIKCTPSLKSFMGTKKAYRKMLMELKKKAREGK
jgi:hypothetical protein